MRKCTLPLVVCALAPTMSRAVDFGFIPSKDNAIYSESPGNSNGAGEYAFVGLNQGLAERRMLMQFDLSTTIPTGSTINSASLRVNCSKTAFGGDPVVGIRDLATSWGEGTSNAGEPGGGGTAATPGDATWSHSFFNTTMWTTAGGDFAATALASQTIGGVGSYTYSSNAALVGSVQSWVTSPAGNLGWILSGTNGSQSARRIDTRENIVPANRPLLSIDWTPPTSAWTDPVSGNWSDGSKWTGGVPDGFGVVADFPAIGASLKTVTVDSPRTVGFLTLAGTGGWSIDGTSTLTINAGQVTARIEVTTGSHVISAPVQAVGNVEIRIAANTAEATMFNWLPAPGTGLNKTGPGRYRVNIVEVFATNVAEGTLQALPGGGTLGTFRTSTLVVAPGAKLDMTDHDLIVDYTGSSSFEDVRANVVSGYASGAWTGDGITSSAAATAAATSDRTALAVAEATDLFTTFPATFSGQQVDNTSVLVKYTLAGDVTMDGTVNGADFNVLATNFGQSLRRWTNGDFTYDTQVNGADFNVLASNFGKTLSAGPGTTVPEPTTLVAIAAMGLTLARCRRMR